MCSLKLYWFYLSRKASSDWDFCFCFFCFLQNAHFNTYYMPLHSSIKGSAISLDSYFFSQETKIILFLGYEKSTILHFYPTFSTENCTYFVFIFLTFMSIWRDFFSRKKHNPRFVPKTNKNIHNFITLSRYWYRNYRFCKKFREPASFNTNCSYLPCVNISRFILAFWIGREFPNERPWRKLTEYLCL